MRTPDPHPDWEPGDEPVVQPPTNPGWLSDLELAEVRGRLPLLYVEAIPVRVDGVGQVTEVGVLLRANAVGEMTRTLVSGCIEQVSPRWQSTVNSQGWPSPAFGAFSSPMRTLSCAGIGETPRTQVPSS